MHKFPTECSPRVGISVVLDYSTTLWWGLHVADPLFRAVKKEKVFPDRYLTYFVTKSSRVTGWDIMTYLLTGVGWITSEPACAWTLFDKDSACCEPGLSASSLSLCFPLGDKEFRIGVSAKWGSTADNPNIERTRDDRTSSIVSV